MKRLAVVLTALALPAGAIAKEPVRATVCGTGGCESSKDAAVIMPLATGGMPAAELPRTAAPFYRVEVTISMDDGSQAQKGMSETFSNWMVPKLGLMRGDGGEWVVMSAATLAAVRKLAGDIRPFPAAKLPLDGFIPEQDPIEEGSGALPPQTYKVEPVQQSAPAAGDDDRTPWWLIAGLVAALGALGAGAMRFRGHRTAGS